MEWIKFSELNPLMALKMPPLDRMNGSGASQVGVLDRSSYNASMFALAGHRFWYAYMQKVYF